MNRAPYTIRLRWALTLFVLEVTLVSFALRATGPHSDRVLVLAGLGAGVVFAPTIVALLFPRAKQ